MTETIKTDNPDNSSSYQPSPRRYQRSRRRFAPGLQGQGKRRDYRRKRRRGGKGSYFAYGPQSLSQATGSSYRASENPHFDKVTEYETLRVAFQALWRGRTTAARRFAGAADRMSLEKFGRNLDANLRRISYELRSGKYRPGPINMFQVPKPGGGSRVVTVLTVKDRLVQRAVLGVIEPLFEPHFLECSYAFRPERSTGEALARVERYYAGGLRWVVDGDIESFFDRIWRERLVNLLAERISDRRMMALLELWLDHTPVLTLEPIFPAEFSVEDEREKLSPHPEGSRAFKRNTGTGEVNQTKSEGDPDKSAEKKRVVDFTRRWLEDGLDWGIERLGGDDSYRVSPSSSHYPRRAYRSYYDEDEREAYEDETYSLRHRNPPQEEGIVKGFLRRYGPDGALWGLSAARKALVHGLPHLPGGLVWAVKGGALGVTGAALGAAGFWAFRQWRKAPTLYEVETAHFRQQATAERAGQSSANSRAGVNPRPRARGYPAATFGQRRGIAQGSILSPLFSNIYLHEFDKEITARGYKLVRFADDLVIVCGSQREAFRALREAEEVLAQMGLNFKPGKTRVTPLAEGFTFLGAEFGSDGRWKNLPDGSRTPNGPRNSQWLERARQSWLGRAVRLKPGVVQKGRKK